MPDPNCIRRRMLLASRQSYTSPLPTTGVYQSIGWIGDPLIVRREPDVAVVGRIDLGILIAFRGTREPFNERDDDVLITFFDWLKNAACVLVNPPIYPGPVHCGFASSIEALWSKVMGEVRRLLDAGAPRALFVTGHSKGGALAALAAWRLAHELDPNPPVRLVTFASARPGGDAFRRAFEAEPLITATRFEVGLDLVPDLPPGADSSPIAQALLSRLPFPTTDLVGYAPVGQRVVGGPGASGLALRFANNVMNLFRRRALPATLISGEIIKAHSIQLPSAYDALVCGSEVACDHS